MKIRDVIRKIRNVIGEAGLHRWKTPLAGAAVALAFVVCAFVVWPSLADEKPYEEDEYEEVSLDEAETEEISEETPAPEEPEATEADEKDEKEPVKTEEPTAAKEPEATQEPAEEEEKAQESPAPEKEPGEGSDSVDAVKPENSAEPAGQKDGTTSSGQVSGKRKAAAARATVSAPIIDEQPQNAQQTYPSSQITLSVRAHVADPDNEVLYYQWFQATGLNSGATGAKALTEPSDSISHSLYTVDAGIDCGTYYYFCRITSRDYRDESDTKFVDSKTVAVTISKATPTLKDFSLADLNNTYYYIGEAIPLEPKPASGVTGIVADYYFRRDGVGNVVEFLEEGQYRLYIRVEASSKNYEATKTDIDTKKILTIRRIAPPATAYRLTSDFTGTKGWYTGPVNIVPRDSNYLISTADRGEFSGSIEVTGDGQDRGPSVVYLKRKSDGAISDAITVRESINIDTEAPEGRILISDSEGVDLPGISDHPTVSLGSTGNVSIRLSASEDRVSGIDDTKVAYYIADAGTEVNPEGLAETRWVKKSEFTKSDDSAFVVYARFVDNAGNKSYTHSPGILLDKTLPVIRSAEGDAQVKAKYTADRKIFRVSDTNLKRVEVFRGNAMDKSYSDEIHNGAVDVQLDAPVNDLRSYSYRIEAEDYSGNIKTYEVEIIKPVVDVKANDVDFGEATYGFRVGSGDGEVKPQIVTFSAGDDNNVKVSVKKLELADADDSKYFAIRSVGSEFQISPKDGAERLSVGTYQAVVRVYYDTEEYPYSTDTLVCRIQVNPKTVTVKYKGSTAWYHTVPNFAGSFEYDGLVEGETEKNLGLTPGMNYRENGNEYSTVGMRTTDLEGKTLIPTGCDSPNYRFQYMEGGTLKVNRRTLENGYEIQGDKIRNNGWYVSDVRICPADGFSMSDTDEPSSFRTTMVKDYTEETDDASATFYIQNEDTGEISLEMTTRFKIDKTAPSTADGQGIIVADNLFYEFLNTVTFEKFFNSTKNVQISGSDSISEPVKIEYYLASHGNFSRQDLESASFPWQEYTGKFYLTPEEYEQVVVYAKLTNEAGLSTYISSDGMVFDNKCPEILAEGVLNSKEGKDNVDYVAEVLTIRVKDPNLTSVTLYEGRDTSVRGTALDITADETDPGRKVSQWSISTEDWEIGDSETYTIVAVDDAENLSERTFTVIKPNYDIEATDLNLTAAYGYSSALSALVQWENTEEANADATVSEVKLSNTEEFSVENLDGQYRITPKTGLVAGRYKTNITLVYNRGKEAEAVCVFTVQKARLKAVYQGQSVYYHMTPTFDEKTVKVTGFVNGETEKTAEGYVAPVVSYKGTAVETVVLTPAGGKAVNYEFDYVSGVLNVMRRDADTGADGQYSVQGTLSDTGWYVSDIEVLPKNGYAISMDEEGKDTRDKIEFTNDTNRGRSEFYLIDEKTGEVYKKTLFAYQKDCVAPVFQGIEDGHTYETNSQEVTVKDSYLANVTVNGVAKPISGDHATFSLSAEEKTTLYVLVATDCAGNVSESTIVLHQPDSISLAGDSSGNASAIESDVKTSTSTGNTATTNKKVKVINGAPKTALTTSKVEVLAAALTDEEKKAVNNGSDATVELRISNIDGSVSQADKELILSQLGGYTVGQYLDITLWKTVGNGEEKKVAETKQPMAVTITIPQSLRSQSEKKTRSFAMFRVHNGSVSLLEDQDSVENTVTFYTDQFSTYALAYRDDSVSSASSSGSAGSSDKSSTGGGGSKVSQSSSTKATTKTSSGSTSGDSEYTLTSHSYSTGDHTPLIPVAIILVCALLGIAAIFIVKWKTSPRE